MKTTPVAGDLEHFTAATIGAQIMILFKMATAHGLTVNEINQVIDHNDVSVRVRTVIDKTGKGLLIYEYPHRKITYQIGGIYAFLLEGSDPLDDIKPMDLLVLINEAMARHRVDLG